MCSADGGHSKRLSPIHGVGEEALGLVQRGGGEGEDVGGDPRREREERQDVLGSNVEGNNRDLVHGTGGLHEWRRSIVVLPKAGLCRVLQPGALLLTEHDAALGRLLFLLDECFSILATCRTTNLAAAGAWRRTREQPRGSSPDGRSGEDDRDGSSPSASHCVRERCARRGMRGPEMRGA